MNVLIHVKSFAWLIWWKKWIEVHVPLLAVNGGLMLFVGRANLIKMGWSEEYTGFLNEHKNQTNENESEQSTTWSKWRDR